MGSAVRIRPGIGFRPIACLYNHFFGQDILLVEKHLYCAAHLVNRPLAAVEGGDGRNQHIGVMLDFIQIKVVLVVIMGALVAVQVVLQLRFQGAILFLGS